MKKESNILIPTSKGVLLERTKNILCICAEGSYCELFLIDGGKHMISRNLTSLSALLSTDTFFRIHASVIINLEHINQIIGNEVVLKNDTRFFIAQRRRKDFLTKLKQKSLSL